jgi:hypothetical protein
MKAGQAFELFVKRILLNIGFSGVASDGLYIFDGTPGQMIQGLGEAHNADVLLEPPVQTPFYWPTRLLIECKDYKNKVGLNILRSTLGLREDINHFRILEKDELEARRTFKETKPICGDERYLYQVALASTSGFSLPAQRFAATHRIPLIEFNKMPFWEELYNLLKDSNEVNEFDRFPYDHIDKNASDSVLVQSINSLADGISSNMAIAITNTGQILFLFRTNGKENTFDDSYTLHWQTENEPWILRTNNLEYIFQLPEEITKVWLSKASSEIGLKRGAIECKTNFLSNMVVYYTKYNKPVIKMISIDKYELKKAKDKLFSDK